MGSKFLALYLQFISVWKCKKTTIFIGLVPWRIERYLVLSTFRNSTDTLVLLLHFLFADDATLSVGGMEERIGLLKMHAVCVIIIQCAGQFLDSTIYLFWKELAITLQCRQFWALICSFNLPLSSGTYLCNSSSWKKRNQR